MRQIFRFNPISRFLRLSINQSIAKFHILKPPYPNLPYTENSLLLQALVACRHTAILQGRDITVFSWNLVQYRSSVYTFPLHCFGIAYLIHDSPSLFTFKSNLKILPLPSDLSAPGLSFGVSLLECVPLGSLLLLFYMFARCV